MATADMSVDFQGSQTLDRGVGFGNSDSTFHISYDESLFMTYHSVVRKKICIRNEQSC